MMKTHLQDTLGVLMTYKLASDLGIYDKINFPHDENFKLQAFPNSNV